MWDGVDKKGWREGRDRERKLEGRIKTTKDKYKSKNKERRKVRERERMIMIIINEIERGKRVIKKRV